MSKNLSELSARKGLEKNLFEEISKSDSDINHIAEDFLIGKSSVKGAVSFYDFLRDENKDKKVYICNGSACLCAGTQEKLKNQLLETFEDNEIGHMTCLGRCHENNAFHYQGTNYSGLNQKQIKDLLSGNKKPKADDYNVGNLGEVVLTSSPISIEGFVNAFNKAQKLGKEQLLHQISVSQLRGRGGAGFPIAIKLKSAKDVESDKKFIICNADEGDPGAYSDRYLLEKQPYSVLFGIMLSAYIVGAEYGILYIRAEYPEAIKIVQKAIDEIHALNLLENFRFKVISAQGAYICGEETALINSIEGQRPDVRTRPPFPAQQGLFNKPTAVNNVETLASLYSIITKGGEFYRNLGTDKSKGTKLVSLDSFFNSPGIYEVEMGTPLKEVIEKCGGGFKQPVKALHIGGPLGGIVPIEKVKDLTLDFESFASQGFLLGHASVVSIPESFPIIEYLHHLFEFAAYESCGKCFPCRLGTKRGEELFTKAIQNKEKISKELLDDLLDTLQQGSLCAHGGGIPLPIRNALQYFESELSEYLE
ncbi:MAG: NADH-ubiquinone oxidoreductase-F iron-sulfur binding region domain-containing protein [Gammaproteobacteria bacterium]